jgi:glucose/arabinose dehydrogenase/plastocyanin
LKKKVAIPIGVTLFFFGFIILAVYVYSISTTTANTNYVQTTKNGNKNESMFYGCTKYDLSQSIHCDPLMNKVLSYDVQNNSSLVYTNSGEPIFAKGKSSLGLEIDAKRMEAVEIPNSFRLNPNKFSISFWIKDFKNPRSYGAVISHTNQEQTAGWSLDGYASPMQFVRLSVFNERGERFASPSVPISNNTFTHVVGTFNGSSLKIYKNGNLIGSTAFKGKYTSDPGLPLRIGSSAFCLTCNWWSQVINDLRFYNKSINENEVKEIFLNDSLGTVSDGLIGYWTFDGNLDDKSGNHNDGILNSIIANMAFTPDGRLFFTEKDAGKIKIMKDDKVLPTPFATVPDHYVNWEQGLLGLTVDPKFEQNHFVYLYYTAIDNKTGQQAQIFNRVVRFTENNNHATDMVVLIDRIPASMGYHSGGALAFGADDKLYIGVGDATEHIFAQDPGIVIGKVLRINRDGTIPKDNPFPNSPVYTIGHRNIFGIAFDIKDNIGIIGEEGDYHYDKINLIQKGGNYGFPTLLPPNVPPELFTNNSAIKPLISYWQTITPTQTIYYVGDKIPQLKNKFLVGAYSRGIYALTLDVHNKQIIEQEHIRLKPSLIEPVISIAQSPSGDIYYGGYHIYKLKSVNVNTKKQYQFPIEIKSSSSKVDIKDLQASSIGNQEVIHIRGTYFTNKSQSSSPSSSPFLQINIPKAIIDHMSSVTSTFENKNTILTNNRLEQQPSMLPVNFALNENSSSSDNAVTIDLEPGIYHLELSIKGFASISDISNTKTANNTIMANTAKASNNITNHTPFVSIVKYASESNIQEPYDPSPLNVAVGTSVKWINNDILPHTVTEGEAAATSYQQSTINKSKFDSGILGPAQTFEHTFVQPGTIKYYCTIHPFMSGEVIVK